jgi:hypothetical protein
MKLEFRESCDGFNAITNGKPTVVACDGTKIKIAL